MNAGVWTAAEWEAVWSPYDEATYASALAYLRPDDVVLDIGAGDLRFARHAAARVLRVIAIEQRAELLSGPRPENLQIVCGDARRIPFPRGVTVGVLLMRHCRHFAEFVARLRVVGCQRLITNARWGMDVEVMPLKPQPAFAQVGVGWYACQCGAVGFKSGPVEEITSDVMQYEQQVEDCPVCGPK